MYVRRLELADFRSYPRVVVEFEPGCSVLVGPNGIGKTNLIEALRYVSALDSHRVATDTPLVRAGASSAVIRSEIVHEGRSLSVELSIEPGRANRARLNGSPARRTRDVLGALRLVLFAPEDLALVRGDPAERRRYLDDLLVARQPRFAAVRADYDRVLKQRNALLRTAYLARKTGAGERDLSTLDVWDRHLAEHGAELLAARIDLCAALGPHIAKAYDAVAAGRGQVGLSYRSTVQTIDGPSAAGQPTDGTAADAPPVDGHSAVVRSEDPRLEAGHSAGDRFAGGLVAGGRAGDGPADSRAQLLAALAAALRQSRRSEIERGVTLVGPHRDDLTLTLGDLPAKGYASHGESWSLALALRLAGYDLLRAEGIEPVLVLDDVFAELDAGRRDRLAELVGAASQVLVTCAVPGDVPSSLAGAWYQVSEGEVRRG